MGWWRRHLTTPTTGKVWTISRPASGDGAFRPRPRPGDMVTLEPAEYGPRFGLFPRPHPVRVQGVVDAGDRLLITVDDR